MKLIGLLSIALLQADAIKHNIKTIPEEQGQKNPNCPEATWEEYAKKRENDPNNCDTDESKNWFGNHKCKFSWECKGAANCEYQVHTGD